MKSYEKPYIFGQNYHMDIEKSYSVIKAAEMLGVCNRTIKNWIYAGKIKTFLTPYGYHRIPESEITKYTSKVK